MEGNWGVLVDKVMLWKSNAWQKYEHRSNKIFLRIHFDQLLITTESKILESLNVYSKIKGIYKEDILILITSVGHEIRKIKFQIKCNVVECLQKLGEMFPVVSHNDKNGSAKEHTQWKYHNIDEVLKIALEQKESTPMPPDFKNFVKLCLLDPNFPQIVVETEKVIKELKQQ